MSTLKTNNIQHVDLADPSILINSDGSVSIAGTMTYEDVTNVDSVGIITGRLLVNAQKQVHVGTGVSVKSGGLNVTAGITTVQALQATTGTFSAAVSGTTGTFSGAVSGTTGTFSGAVSGTTGTFTGDVSIPDTIVHTGDTNTKIRFPAADTFTVETAGTEHLRVTSGGELQVTGGTGANVIINAATHDASTANQARLQLAFQHSGGQALGHLKIDEAGNNSFDGIAKIGVPYNNGSGAVSYTHLTLPTIYSV